MTEFPDSVKAYTFDLPEELIAQEPAPERSAARLLVVRRHPSGGLPRFEDLKVSDLPELLSKELPQSLWVRNRSRVMPARFYAERKSGSRHEIVLLEEGEPGIWKAILRKSSKMKFPESLVAHGERFTALDAETLDLRTLSLPLHDFLEKFGEMPLPPYIKSRIPQRDKERYQSVWAVAEKNLSVAAPTASLHFTDELVEAMQKKAGAKFADIFLHVGLGTFEPLRQDSLSAHKIHSERWEISPAEFKKIMGHSGPRVALGTTALRTLETLALEERGDALHGRTQIFIKGHYPFKLSQALFTNFHLPESTLFVLLSSFAGSLTLAQEAYAHAVQKRYHFFSYGDASIWI